MNFSIDTRSRQTVLIVDDSPANLSLMGELLKNHYKVLVANSGAKALKIARSMTPPDIILLDIMMPELDGYAVCRLLKQDSKTSDIPIIFLTAKTDVESEAYGFALGAVDYITKPVSPPIVLARVKAQLQIKSAADFLKGQAQFLEQEIIIRSRDLASIQELTIVAMAALTGTHVQETGFHLRRTQYFLKALAEKLRFHPRFVGFLSDYHINMLFWVAPLHDIGMTGIPSQILEKAYGIKLNPEDFEIVKTHTTLGFCAIQKAERSLGIRADYLAIAKEIILSHHERMDGSGYPNGFAGDAIPISARMMAIADVYDALVNERNYKLSVPHIQAVEIMREGRGSQFDPDMLDAFLEIQDEFNKINQSVFAER